jgi:hypothetical protein
VAVTAYPRNSKTYGKKGEEIVQMNIKAVDSTLEHLYEVAIATQVDETAIVLRRFIFAYSWEQIAADYNLLNGGLMPIGLVLLTLSPLIAAKIRGVSTEKVLPHP